MTRLLVLAFAIGCGGHPAPATPKPSPPHDALVMETSPNDRECDALIDHAVDLGLAERTPKPPDAQVAAVRDDLRAKYGHDCRRMPRKTYDCAVSAATLAALDACSAHVQ